MSEAALQEATKWGGIWSSHPVYELEDWQYETSENNTRLSYWDWVLAQIEGGHRGGTFDAADFAP